MTTYNDNLHYFIGNLLLLRNIKDLTSYSIKSCILAVLNNLNVSSYVSVISVCFWAHVMDCLFERTERLQ